MLDPLHDEREDHCMGHMLSESSPPTPWGGHQALEIFSLPLAPPTWADIAHLEGVSLPEAPRNLLEGLGDTKLYYRFMPRTFCASEPASKRAGGCGASL